MTDRAVELADECCGGASSPSSRRYSLRHLPAANLAILEGWPAAVELPQDPVGCDIPRCAPRSSLPR